MELKKLKEFATDLFRVQSNDEMPEKIFETVRQNNHAVYKQFEDFVGNDLSIDYMQMIYQYYYADRKEKMQDYTPKTLADFMGLLVGDSDTIVDLCAGSGALTIQKWNRNKNLSFALYEYDEKVIPFLLFNMAIRDIPCVVYHSDVLQQEIFHAYKIEKGEKYGIFKEV